MAASICQTGVNISLHWLERLIGHHHCRDLQPLGGEVCNSGHDCACVAAFDGRGPTVHAQSCPYLCPTNTGSRSSFLCSQIGNKGPGALKLLRKEILNHTLIDGSQGRNRSNTREKKSTLHKVKNIPDMHANMFVQLRLARDIDSRQFLLHILETSSTQ